MGLTPKRVQRFLDAWDEATEPGRETAFNGYLVLGLLMTVATLILRQWWFAFAGLVFTLVALRMLWELPTSRVRRLFDSLRDRR